MNKIEHLSQGPVLPVKKVREKRALRCLRVTHFVRPCRNWFGKTIDEVDDGAATPGAKIEDGYPRPVVVAWEWQRYGEKGKSCPNNFQTRTPRTEEESALFTVK